MNSETVLLERYTSSLEAEMARGILEGSKIECFIANQSMASMYPSAPLVYFDLMVRDEDLELSREILSAKFVKE